MDPKIRNTFLDHFFENSVFFLESARIYAGLSKYVLLQQTFSDTLLNFTPELKYLLQCYLSDEIGVNELYSRIRVIERSIKQETERNVLSKLCEKLGLRIHPKIFFVNRILSTPPLLISVDVYVSKSNGSELDRLQDIERKILKGKVDRTTGRGRIIRLEGKILGYPECCIENYAQGKETGKSAERNLVDECLTKGYFDSLLSHYIHSKILFTPSLFTSNFYPCSIGCLEAVEIGEKIRDWLADLSTSLSTPFEFRTMVNGLYLLTTAYKTYIHKKSQKLEQFFSKLDENSINLVGSVATVISNLTDFTNTLIARIFRN
jgi:hypothetical protein